MIRDLPSNVQSQRVAVETPTAVPQAWRIGENVPWSVAWTGEQQFDLRMSDDFPGLLELVQVERQGEGEPKLASQHVMRHRRGMAYHLCHVCGTPTSKRDRYIFPVQTGGFVTLPDEQTRYAGNVPPVHLKCAKLGKQVCPHLSHTPGTAVMVPSEDSRLMPRPDVVQGMEALAKTMPPNLKIVYGCYRLYGPRFTKLVKKLRQESSVSGGLTP